MIPLSPARVYGKGFKTSRAPQLGLQGDGQWSDYIPNRQITRYWQLLDSSTWKNNALAYTCTQDTFEIRTANMKGEGLNPPFISSTGPILQSAKPTVHFHQVLQISKILNESWKNDYESTVLFDCIILFKIKITIIKRPLSECNSTKTSSQKLLLLFMSECILNSSNHLPLWTLN